MCNKYLIVAFITVGIFYLAFGNSKKEGYSNLNPGDYPIAIDNPILYNVYTVNPHKQVSALNASDIYKDYPIYSATSTKNNNVRYWGSPDNGTCSRAELCESIYEKSPNTKENIPNPPKEPGWNKRVNYYNEIYDNEICDNENM
jgi:hypothetical protein